MAFLQKPFSADDLTRKVRALLDETPADSRRLIDCGRDPAAPSRQPQLSQLLHRAGGLAARRPDHADRAAADRGARAARVGGADGGADDGRARPEPDLLAARRQLGRSPRRPPAGDARDGRLPRPPDRDDPGGLRARPPDLGAAVRRRVRLRGPVGLLLRRLRRLLPDDRGARGLRRRQLADARQPRLLVPRRHEPRRHPRAALARAVRARDRRGVVPLVGALPRRGSTRTTRPPGPQDSGGILAGARWIRGNAIIRAELLGRRDAQPLQLHLLRAVPALRDAVAARPARRRSGSCSAARRSGRCSARSSPGACRAGSASARRSSSAASSSPRR